MSRPTKSNTTASLALLAAAFAIANLTHAAAATQSKEAVRVPTSTDILKPGGGQQPPAAAQITSVTYKQNPNDPQYVTLTINGSGNAANCFADVTLGAKVNANYKIGSFPNAPTWYAPADGEQIRVKALSGCTGDVSVIFHKAAIDPSQVGTIGVVQVSKQVYKQGESTGLTVQGTVGQAPCFVRVTIDGGIISSQIASAAKPFPQTIANAGVFAPGLHTVTVDGMPNAPAAPACKGTATANFKVESNAADAPTITSVVIPNPPFKAGQAQYITINGSGNCQYRLDYSDGFKSNVMQATAANPFPHSSNVHPIATPGNYIVTAVTLGNCNGGSGAGFTVVP